MPCRYLLLLLLFPCNLLPGYAQQPLLRHYTISDGLPSNTVYSIFQDSRGFMWFCTDWGVCRFDGHHFEKITSDDGLLDNEVFSIYEDAWQRLWLNTYNQRLTYIYNDKVFSVLNDTLCQYMEKEGLIFPYITFSPYLTKKEHHASGQNSTTNLPDTALRSSRYQFNDQGIDYYFYYRKIIRKDHAKLTTVLETKGYYFRAALYLNGHLYVSVLSDTDRYPKLFYDIIFKEGKPLIKEVKAPYSILTFTSGKNGKLWCCTTEGISEYDPARNSIGEDQFIAMKGIVSYSSFIDKQGNCWYATNEGVYMQPVNTVLAYTAASGLANNNVNAVCHLPGGKLMAGYDNGRIMIREGHTFRFFGVVINSDESWNRILYFLPAGEHTFFAGTDCGLFKGDIRQKTCLQMTKFPEKSAAIRDGILLLCRNAGIYGNNLVYTLASGRFDTLSSLNNLIRVTATTIDTKGVYWLGTMEGLYYYDKTLQKFIRDSAFPNNRVTSLNILKGRLIISTHTNGIYIRDGYRMLRINEKNGLVSNICKRTYIDEKERLWINTEKGLARVTFSEDFSHSVYHFSAADGVPGHMINDITFGDGKAYLATSSGIIIIDQDQTSRSLPYKVYILKVSFKDSVINYPKSIALNYNQNNVQVTYTAISYLEGRDITYKYLLRGAGNDTVITEEGTLNLGALEPGSYELMVWAAGKNNVWNNTPAILYITVSPPFWGKGWFIAGAGFLLLLLITLAYKYRISSVRKKEAEKAERKKMIAELEMQALRAQINPHFMFNALNAIQNYYNKNDELGANYYMASFSRLIRKTLIHSKEHWNTIANEMSMLKAYIELEQMRFRHHFSYEIFVEPGLEECKIPTMLLQTYTENAINHGLRHLQHETGKLFISCRKNGDAIVCIIEDNGVGFEKAQKLDSRPDDYKSMGLKITAGRIAAINELYGTSIITKITDRQHLDKNSQGTIIEITIKNIPLL